MIKTLILFITYTLSGLYRMVGGVFISLMGVNGLPFNGKIKSVLKLVDDLNNGRPYPFKIIETDYSNKYGIGVKCSKKK